MSELQGDPGSEDLRRQMREAIAEATTSPAARQRKLVFWSIRQVLLCALAWYFWDKTWMRWVFWIGVAVAVLNMAMILLMPRFLTAQMRKGSKAADRLDALARESQEEHRQGT